MPPESHRPDQPLQAVGTTLRPGTRAGILSAIVASLIAALSQAQEKAQPKSGWEETPKTIPGKFKAATDWDAAAATAVIYNKDVRESVDLAQFYAKRRGIPAANLIGLSCSPSETISRGDYLSTIRDPLVRILSERKLWRIVRGAPGGSPVVASRTIRIFAPVFGIPVRIERIQEEDGKRKSVPAGKGDEASVDSELALLSAFRLNIEGPLKNPYFKKDTPFSSFDAASLFLVARLDGPSPEVVRRMINDSLAVEESGLSGFAYFDLAKKGTGYESGDLWIGRSEEILRSHGLPTVVDPHPGRLPKYYPMRDAAVYFGWYTGHIDGPFLNPDFEFAPGAIACHLHSFSAQQLRQSTRHWPGPLLRRGAAASLGNVWEPYLALTVNFDIFTDRLLKGYTFAEASWMATPALSWMNIAVGDPLYRPFKPRRVGPPVGEAPDPESEFALYHRLSSGRPEVSGAAVKRALVEAARERKSGFLLEGAGLLSAAASRHAEAIGLFEHAFATYQTEPDKIRAQLHIADIHRRSGEIPAAKETLNGILSNFPKAAGAHAAREFLKRLEE